MKSQLHKTQQAIQSALDHLNAGKLQQAGRVCQDILKGEPDNAEANHLFGVINCQFGQLDKGILFIRKAIKIKNNYVEAHKNLGKALKIKGNLEEAAESYQRALQIEPKFTAAHCQLAFIKRHAEYDDEIKAMEILLQASKSTDRDKVNLSFGLGKAFEDLKQYEKAFSYILEGNRLKRNTYDYDISEDRELFARIKEVFCGEFFAEFASAGFHDETPVFILGMLRSGTTLLEQTLAAHPQVHGAGELHYIQSMIQYFCCGEEDREYPGCMGKFSVNEYAEMGRAYVERLRQHPEDARYIINKMPHNFLHVGFIKLILPQARIIHSKRNPMDTCLSIFKNLFAGTHMYAYNLEELGQYFKLYEGLMKHWNSVLPGHILELHYEDMVADQENQTRKLLDFCGLDWDDACLSFHKSSRAVRTSSLVQVRQPIYKSSVQLWKRYEKELQPLLEALDYSE